MLPPPLCLPPSRYIICPNMAQSVLPSSARARAKKLLASARSLKDSGACRLLCRVARFATGLSCQGWKGERGNILQIIRPVRLIACLQSLHKTLRPGVRERGGVSFRSQEDTRFPGGGRAVSQAPAYPVCRLLRSSADSLWYWWREKAGDSLIAYYYRVFFAENRSKIYGVNSIHTARKTVDDVWRSALD